MLAFAACNADIESVEQQVITPDMQDPAAYALYMDALRSYKQSDHYLVYAHFDNAPAIIASEKNSLRSLPDSLDIVALRNPLSSFDREDLAGVQRKSTRVLTTADCSDPTKAVAQVDNAIATIAANGLDGVVVYYSGPVTDAARTAEQAIATKLATLGKMVVFEGNASFVAAANRNKYALYLLDASTVTDVYALRNKVEYMTGFMSIPAAKILPAIDITGSINDEQGKPQSAYSEVPKTVFSLGLGGLALYEISKDYYAALKCYTRTREAINLLNPAQAK